MPTHVSDVWEASRTIYQAVAVRKGATIWGEKTHWCDGALSLAEQFPDARFIFLWRGLHDVMGSIARGAATERFYRKKGLRTKTLVGSEKLRQACDALKVRGHAVHELYYEDLASNPIESMQRICEFLGVSFESGMASLKGADRSAIEGGDGQHHSGLWHDRIAVEREQDDISPALRLKIDRYLCYWRRRCEGWPKYPADRPQADCPPSMTELWLDRITYRGLIFRDELIKALYALTPLAVARSLRSWLHERSMEPNYCTSAERASEKIEIPG